MSNYNSVYENQNQLTFNEFLTKVYSIVAIGVATSAFVAYIVSLFLEKIYIALGDALFIAIIIFAVAEIVVALVLSAKLRKLSKKAAWILYIVYSILTGLSLSFIFIEYTSTSIWLAFIVTAIMFVSMALIGHTTKVDLSKFSGLIAPALISIIIATILNALIFKSNFFSWIITYAGIVVFLGLVAYDMRMLRNYYYEGISDANMLDKIMIFGAFQLYLDFINLFIRILRIIGKRNSD